MNPNRGSAPVEVLLVEGNPDDAWRSMRALEGAGAHKRIHLAMGGEAARDFLHGRGAHTGAPVPDLILLELNLPKEDGWTLLEEIKGNDGLRHIPVVVIAGSAAEKDVTRSYGLHANAYVTKPKEADAFLGAINAIERFWLEVVKLP